MSVRQNRTILDVHVVGLDGHLGVVRRSNHTRAGYHKTVDHKRRFTGDPQRRPHVRSVPVAVDPKHTLTVRILKVDRTDRSISPRSRPAVGSHVRQVETAIIIVIHGHAAAATALAVTGSRAPAIGGNAASPRQEAHIQANASATATAIVPSATFVPPLAAIGTDRSVKQQCSRRYPHQPAAMTTI